MNNIVQLPQMTATDTMSSLEIAKATGKKHLHVIRDIKKILEEAKIGESKFGSTYLDKSNRQSKCYNLPRMECDLVMSGYSAKYRMLIIERWYELEAKAQTDLMASLPQDYPTAMRALADSFEENMKLTAQAKTDAPKVAIMEALQGDEDLHSNATAAKILGMGQRELMRRLRAKKIYQGEGKNMNVAYQKYVTSGHFLVKWSHFEDPQGKVYCTATTYITNKGIAYMKKVLIGK